MSRPPLPPLPPTDDIDVSHLPEAINTAALIAQAEQNGVEAGKLIGRIEALHFSATVAEKAIVETAIFARDGKKYKGLSYYDENQNLRHVADFEEFCRIFLKLSYRRVHELMTNYHVLGPELFDQAQALGLKQRDFNAIKALPPTDQEILKEAVAAGERDQLIALLEEMAARHGSEKAAAKAEAEKLQRQIDEHRNAAEASARILRQKNDKIDDLARQLDGRAHMPQDARRELALRQLHDTALNCAAAVSTDLLRESLALLDTCDGAPPEVVTQALLGAVAQVMGAARDLATDLGIVGLLDGLLPMGDQS